MALKSVLLFFAFALIHEVFPQNNEYLGCYVDNQARRLLNGHKVEMKRNLTPSRCISYCAERHYTLAGLEFKVECFCGVSLDGGSKAQDIECYYKCPGDRTKICGGDVRLSVYSTGLREVQNPSGLNQLNNTRYLGCFVDPSEDSRLMRGATSIFKGINTKNLCHNFCSSRRFKYAGTEFDAQCFCSNERPSYKSLSEESECNTQCEGSPNEKCGGYLRLSVYDLSPGNESNSFASQYEGCFSAPLGSRIPATITSTLTLQYCIRICYKRGQRYAKLRGGQECDCTDDITGGRRVGEDMCDNHCGGEPSLKCGGQNHESIYNTGIPDKNFIPVVTTYLGCFTDSKQRLLNGPSFIDKKMTQEKCIKYCFDRAFKVAGMEFGEECFCGDAATESARTNDGECQVKCPGTITQKCGGLWRLSVYSTGLTEYRKSVEKQCSASSTIVGGVAVCSGQVIFSEEFDAKIINENKWRDSIIMPKAPDYPFVIYQRKSNNIFVEGGSLVIKPSIMDSELVERGSIQLRNCTGYLSDECSRQAASYNILPPIESAMISTKRSFFFKYGKVEIRAQIPRGDWLVPALWLEPKRRSYGPYYSSGRIIVAMARGNTELNCGSLEMGNRRLEAGIAAGIEEEPYWKMVNWNSNEAWSQTYHNYTLTWTPDNLLFSVDGGQEKTLLSKGQKISDLFPEANSPPWASGSSMAPFDEEFYISLGLYAGGMRDFLDSCTNRGKAKPWENFATKATANFWRARNDWENSWQSSGASSLKVDYVRVTAV